MRRIIIIALCILVLGVAYFTKPDDKTIIIQSVTRFWGDRSPTVQMPVYYNQFMDLNSKSVEINDWIFIKRVRYHLGSFNRTIGIAAFSHIFFY